MVRKYTMRDSFKDIKKYIVYLKREKKVSQNYIYLGYRGLEEIL